MCADYLRHAHSQIQGAVNRDLEDVKRALVEVGDLQQRRLAQAVNLGILTANHVTGGDLVMSGAQGHFAKVLPRRQRAAGSGTERLALLPELHTPARDDVQACNDAAARQGRLVLGQADDVVGVHGVLTHAVRKLFDGRF